METQSQVSGRAATVHLGAYCPRELAVAVRERADEEFTNVSAVIRRALAWYLEQGRRDGDR